MTTKTFERRLQQLIDEVCNHPYKEELIVLAYEQLADDQGLSCETVKLWKRLYLCVIIGHTLSRDMKRVTVVFRTDDHTELKIYAAKHGRTMNDIIVEAVKTLLQNAVDTDDQALTK